MTGEKVLIKTFINCTVTRCVKTMSLTAGRKALIAATCTHSKLRARPEDFKERR